MKTKFVTGQPQESQVDRLDSRGVGQADHGDWRFSIAGAFPGEHVVAEVEHVGRQQRHAHGRLLEVLQPLEARRDAPCRHHAQRPHTADLKPRPRCGGCPWMSIDPAEQAVQKQNWLQQHHGLEVDRFTQGEHALGYRWSSKRVVGGRRRALLLGSYIPHSHNVAAMGDCLVDHPDIAAVAQEIQRKASALEIVPFNESSSSGDFRYVWLKTDGQGAVLVTLVSATSDSRLPELAEELELPAGIALAVQPGKGNSMRSNELRHLRGLESLKLRLCGHEVEVGPLGFLQPNPQVAAMAYRSLVYGREPAAAGTEPTDRGGLALDLYAGAGITRAMLQRRFDEVLACEVHPESAASLGIEPSTAEAFLQQLLLQPERHPELVIANPPRAGLGKKVCELLVELYRRHPFPLRMMSCSPASLARDLQQLEAAFAADPGASTGAPGMHLEWLEGFDTLPQTAHVELVASLT